MATEEENKTPLDIWWVRYLIIYPLIIILHFLGLVRQILETILRFAILRKGPAVVRTPDEKFQGLESVGYTFKPNYVNLPIGGGKTLPRLHYLDEGPRDAPETLLCLHGEPTWSFLYRKMIPGLVGAGYRVIVPDFIGFGKSDKFTIQGAYSYDLHKQTLRLLLDYLGLKDVTFVGQDWGGKIGLGTVKDSPHYFSRLVIMNTALPTGDFDCYSRGPGFLLWRGAIQAFGTSLPLSLFFKRVFVNSTPGIVKGYSAPFPTELHKAGLAVWPLHVPVTSHTHVAADMVEIHEFLSTKWKKPVLIMFSDRDPVMKGEDKKFARILPQAVCKPITGAKHFLQEDKGEELSAHIVSFISGKL